MKLLSIATLMLVFSGSAAFAADQTFTGQISDSMCGLSHKTMMEHDKTLKTDRACTEACVKAGAKYVFVTQGKVYMIANQSDPQLATHAGHTVRLTGDMKGDTITVSKIVMPAASKAPTKS